MKTPRPWCWSWVIVQDGCSGKSVFLKENQHRFCNSFYEAWPPAQVTRSRFFFQIRIVPIKRFSPTERCFLRSTLRFVFPTSYSLIQCCCCFFQATRENPCRICFQTKETRRFFFCQCDYLSMQILLHHQWTTTCRKCSCGSIPIEKIPLHEYTPP